ncbi:hypothetical protein [Aminithiophilus ramosus]|nr:hypothetical protein [Aminithiophilus ramosus]
MLIESKSALLGNVIIDPDKRLLFIEKGTPDGGPLLMQLPDEPGQ